MKMNKELLHFEKNIYIFTVIITHLSKKHSHMKRNIFIFCTMFFVLSAGAQQIKQEVIASAGGYNVAGTEPNKISISWTLGETIIPTFESADHQLILTHGFQQKLIITTVEQNIAALIQVTIYPNPTSAMLNVKFDTPTDAVINLSLLDAQGKLVKTDLIEADVTSKIIDMQDFPAGIYYLRMIKGKQINVYKVVKL
jgi:hypothetical protein